MSSSRDRVRPRTARGGPGCWPTRSARHRQSRPPREPMPMGGAVWLLPEADVYAEPGGVWLGGDADVTRRRCPRRTPLEVSLRAGASDVVVCVVGTGDGEVRLPAGETRDGDDGARGRGGCACGPAAASGRRRSRRANERPALSGVWIGALGPDWSSQSAATVGHSPTATSGEPRSTSGGPARSGPRP